MHCKRFSFTRTFLVCPAKFAEYLCRPVTDLHMFFNTSKSQTMIFEPRSRFCACLFPSFTLMSTQLKVVDNVKYLGHLKSSKSGDNDDILHQTRLLFARTNVLLRKFSGA